MKRADEILKELEESQVVPESRPASPALSRAGSLETVSLESDAPLDALSEPQSRRGSVSSAISFETVSTIEIINSASGFSMEAAQDLSRSVGMRPEHIKAIADDCVANKTVSGFRQVNPSAIVLMQEMNAIGKPMITKGKSGDTGLIFTDQTFSKLGAEGNLAKIAEFNHKVQDMFKEHGADTVQTRFEKAVKEHEARIGRESKEARQSPETFLPDIHVVSEQPYQVSSQQVFGFKDSKGNPLKVGDKIVLGVDDGNGGYKMLGTSQPLDIPKEFLPQALKVASYQKVTGVDYRGNVILSGPRPLTADYDQLALGTLKGRGVDRGQSTFDKDRGTVDAVESVFTTALIEDTKSHMGVNHGPETGNPFPEKFTDGPPPYTFFVPNGDKCEVYLRNSESEIIDLYNKLSDKFDMPVNPLWGWRRNDANKLEIDPNRVDAQSLALEMGKIEDPTQKKAYKDMVDKLKELGEANVLPMSTQGREATVQKLEEELRVLKLNYSSTYCGGQAVPGFSTRAAETKEHKNISASESVPMTTIISSSAIDSSKREEHKSENPSASKTAVSGSSSDLSKLATAVSELQHNGATKAQNISTPEKQADKHQHHAKDEEEKAKRQLQSGNQHEH